MQFFISGLYFLLRAHHLQGLGEEPDEAGNARGADPVGPVLGAGQDGVLWQVQVALFGRPWRLPRYVSYGYSENQTVIEP